MFSDLYQVQSSKLSVFSFHNQFFEEDCCGFSNINFNETRQMKNLFQNKQTVLFKPIRRKNE